MNVTRPKVDDANYDAAGNLSDCDMVEDYSLNSTGACLPPVNHNEDNRGRVLGLSRVA